MRLRIVELRLCWSSTSGRLVRARREEEFGELIQHSMNQTEQHYFYLLKFDKMTLTTDDLVFVFDKAFTGIYPLALRLFLHTRQSV